MAAPVTGPFVADQDYPFASLTRRIHRQAMPVDRPLPYTMYYYYGKRTETQCYSGACTTTHTKAPNFGLLNDSEGAKKLVACRNLAYERLKAQLSGSAGWAENLAQIGKTRRSIVERSVQLATFATALRKGRFGEAARVLRTPVPSGVSNRKAVSQNFLEFEYGWKPIFQDIVESADILTSFPAIHQRIVGRARDRISRLSKSFSFTDNSSFTQSLFSSTVTSGFVGVHLQTIATVTNPNLFLANQLGIIDFALPWKLIPFSFVVDWFVNVEQVLSSVSDWYGVTLQDSFTTNFTRGNENDVTRNRYWVKPSGSLDNSFDKDFDKECVELLRTLGISGPTLAMKPFQGFSIRRGAQAIALVLNVLGK